MKKQVPYNLIPIPDKAPPRILETPMRMSSIYRLESDAILLPPYRNPSMDDYRVWEDKFFRRQRGALVTARRWPKPRSTCALSSRIILPSLPSRGIVTYPAL